MSLLERDWQKWRETDRSYDRSLFSYGMDISNSSMWTEWDIHIQVTITFVCDFLFEQKNSVYFVCFSELRRSLNYVKTLISELFSFLISE